jgi:Na+-translocating ferredoxin:NAD+ oxidoreductase RnfG subunit
MEKDLVKWLNDSNDEREFETVKEESIKKYKEEEKKERHREYMKKYKKDKYDNDPQYREKCKEINKKRYAKIKAIMKQYKEDQEKVKIKK